jgi:hypothetical protein
MPLIPSQPLLLLLTQCVQSCSPLLSLTASLEDAFAMLTLS